MNDKFEKIIEEGFSVPDSSDKLLQEQITKVAKLEHSLGSYIVSYEEYRQKLLDALEKLDAEKKDKLEEVLKEKEKLRSDFEILRRVAVEDENKSNYNYITELKKFIDMTQFGSLKEPKVQEEINNFMEYIKRDIPGAI